MENSKNENSQNQKSQNENQKNQQSQNENSRNENSQNQKSQTQNSRNENSQNENSQNKNSQSKTNKGSEDFKMSGNWSDQSRELKNKYSQLTDEDLKFETGKENDMLQRVEKRLNKNREEVINIIKKGQQKTA